MFETRVIYGGQFGSESKRLFTEYYANKWRPDIIITNAMPNSGGFDSADKKWSALPIGYPCKLMISPGSVIDPDNLKKEIKQLPEGAEVLIHQNAAVINKDNILDEKSFIRIGSTMTGGATSVMQKMERNPEEKILAKHFFEGTLNNTQWLNTIHRNNKILAICAQGHSLSINFGFWPYTTSRNTSPAQVIADAGLPMQTVKKVIGCFRAFPIRVSNRIDDNGKMIGYSGPGYDDQAELSWDMIGVPKEFTSVSKKVRRVFSFSYDQLIESIRVNGTTDIFLGFINYLNGGHDQEIFVHGVSAMASAFGCNLSWIGHGKTIDDIVEADEYRFNKTWIK